MHSLLPVLLHDSVKVVNSSIMGEGLRAACHLSQCEEEVPPETVLCSPLSSETIAQFRSVHAACFEQPLHVVHIADAFEPCGDRSVLTHKTTSSATVVVLRLMHTIQHCVCTVVRAVRQQFSLPKLHDEDLKRFPALPDMTVSKSV